VTYRKDSALKKSNLCIGVISDTHGILPPGVNKIFNQVDRIFHAGDIGEPEILEVLNRIAPVTAVRGNMDSDRWADGLATTEVVEIGDLAFYIIHDLSGLDIDPEASGVQAVISGHTHRPDITRKNGIIYMNPGSAGHARYHNRATVGMLNITGNAIQAEIHKL
jgi:putative phosphoesterase